MLKYNLEYLIQHENEINWDEISKDKEQFLSLVETRLFRKRINWKVYLLLHQNWIDDKILECASKYFTKEIYTIISAIDIAGDKFILAHRKDVDFKLLIENSHVSEDTLLATMEIWKEIPDIKKSFANAKYIDIESEDYSKIKLILFAYD